MRSWIAFACGGVFAAGACISGMTRPAKVLGLLDLGGAFDPSLLLVMASALAVHAIAWRVVARSGRPRYGTSYPGPAPLAIDRRLVAGAALFGVGWGIAGFCPGPAVVAIASGAASSLVFVVTMAATMALIRTRASGASGSCAPSRRP